MQLRLKSIRRSCSGVTPISLASIFHLSICPFFLFFVNSQVGNYSPCDICVQDIFIFLSDSLNEVFLQRNTRELWLPPFQPHSLGERMKLTLNKSKTEFMTIGSRQRLCTFNEVPCLTIDGSAIKHVHDTRSLGVQIDENMSWDVQQI